MAEAGKGGIVKGWKELEKIGIIRSHVINFIPVLSNILHNFFKPDLPP